MKLELKFFNYLCETQVFTINDIKADWYDFGEKYDHESDEDGDECCGNMMFTPKPFSIEILNKYGITEKEYDEIADKLIEGLSFGNCGLCN